ncbi:MAG: SGNH/GDSL hydrolase family protein [Christensenellales bacterium]
MRKVTHLKNFMIGVLVIILLLLPIAITLSYFTDNKTLNTKVFFGDVEILVDDNTTEDKTSTSLCLSVLRDTNNDGVYETVSTDNLNNFKILPGDKVGVTLRMTLSENSDDAYYLVTLTSNQTNLFRQALNRSYFLNNNTMFYVINSSNNIKVYDATTDSQITSNINYVGKLQKSDEPVVLSFNYDILSNLTQSDVVDILGGDVEVNVSVKAIQSANISQLQAYKKLTSTVDLVGKKVSILGDSISTYRNYSNNAEYNSTLTANTGIHYPDYNTTLGSVDNTWWKKIMDKYEMSLCVNNSQGGSTIKESYNTRALQLHNDNTNTNPDLIFVYLGVNDINKNGTANPLSEIDFDSLITKTSDGYSYKVTSDFAELYAIMIHKIMIKYNTADIVVMNIPISPLTSSTEAKAQYRVNLNQMIKFVAQKFNLGFVDLENTDISCAENNAYLNDHVHPNKEGMQVMAEAVDNALKEYFA